MQNKINSKTAMERETIKRGSIIYNGVTYATLEVSASIIAPDEFKDEDNITLKLADFDVWCAISDPELDCPKGILESNIDDDIYYYCDNGFIESNPTIEELKAYFSGI